MKIAAPYSLVGALQRDPAPSPKLALEAVRSGGEQLLAGRSGVLPQAPQLLEAAATADGLSKLSREVLNSFGGQELPVDKLELQLQTAGLKQVGQGYVAADYEHHFEMSYGSNGGFRGSRSYDSPGETSLARFQAYQQPGAAASDPAVVRVDYTRPGHVGPSIEGTIMDSLSSATSLYFTPDLSRVQGLQGETIGGDATCKERLETAFKSLDQASPVQLHNYTTGYGRVGTYYSEKARVAGQDVTNRVEAAAATLKGLGDVLKMSGPASPAPAPEIMSKTNRILSSVAVGGAAGVLGMALSGLHPLAGAALAAVTLGGAGALGHFAHKDDKRDFPIPDARALAERNQARARRGLQNGLLLGSAVAASGAAGAAFGWQGAVLAAACCAGLEALLAESSQARGC